MTNFTKYNVRFTGDDEELNHLVEMVDEIIRDPEDQRGIESLEVIHPDVVEYRFDALTEQGNALANKLATFCGAGKQFENVFCEVDSLAEELYYEPYESIDSLSSALVYASPEKKRAVQRAKVHFAIAEHAKRFHRWTLYFDNLEHGEKILKRYFRKDWKDPVENTHEQFKKKWEQFVKEAPFKGWTQKEVSRWMKLAEGDLP